MSEALSISYCPPLGGLITILGHEDSTLEGNERIIIFEAIDENQIMAL